MVSRNLYFNVQTYLLVFQTAALLEVLHAAVGLVRSNPVLVFLQVLSRLLVVWAVLYPFPAARTSVGLITVCLAWPFAEIVRYIYYAVNILNVMPHFIAWCRYSFFIILYPIGVTGELICIYSAVVYLQPVSLRKRYSYNLPNALNFSFDLQYFFIFSMLMYLPVFPMLYNHMLVQRKKVLGGGKKKAE
jgi:very-long-chain (3R)-3-hydroxyacyl-CoA dehydratase